MFQPASRYYGIPLAQLETVDGRIVKYVRRRFVPQSDRFEPLLEHVVADGDRLDTIAAKYLDDPEQFWRICDANGALRPDELTERIGRRLRIALAEGLAVTRGL